MYLRCSPVLDSGATPYHTRAIIGFCGFPHSQTLSRSDGTTLQVAKVLQYYKAKKKNVRAQLLLLPSLFLANLSVFCRLRLRHLSQPRQTHMKERFNLRFLVADVGTSPVLQDLALGRNHDGLWSAS